MTFTADTLSLSALKPIKLTYKFNYDESLQSEFNSNDINLNYITHELLSNAEDTAISKHTVLSLTQLKNLETIFEKNKTDVSIKNIGSTFYLKYFLDSINEEHEIKLFNGLFYVGGKGETAIFHTLPVEPGVVELKANDKYVYIQDHYPYNLIAANEPLVDSEIYRQRFSIEYNNGELTLQATTKAGKRYIACGSDRMVRAIGTELNTLKINNYHLQPTFISSTVVDYDFDSTSREVKYFNETSETNNQKTVNVKTQSQLDTNLLVSCPSLELTKANEVGVNIALVKTNFSTLGTFNTSF